MFGAGVGVGDCVASHSPPFLDFHVINLIAHQNTVKKQSHLFESGRKRDKRRDLCVCICMCVGICNPI